MAFYRIENLKNRWTVHDPSNVPMYLTGMNHLGDGSVYPFDMETKYGSRAGWLADLKAELSDWGINHVGPTLCGHSHSRAYLQPKQRKGQVINPPELLFEGADDLDYPFTVIIDLPGNYEIRWQNYPDVFSCEFRDMLDKRIQTLCEPLKDNPNLIGYFFTHNPQWSHIDLGKVGDFTTWIQRTVGAQNSPARVEWMHTMQQIYGTVERYAKVYYPILDWEEILTMDGPMNGAAGCQWVREDQIVYTRSVAKEWYRIWHDTIRKYDPNHLILGDRNTIHLQVLPTYILDCMEPYVDALSINMMGSAEMMMRNLRPILSYWKKPIFPADVDGRVWDRREKSGAKLRNDEAVGEFYWDHLRMGIEHPQLIGIAWCSYWETTVHHSGVKDPLTGDVNTTVVNAMKEANAWAKKEAS